MDPDISMHSVQRKVQYDIRLYFACYGCENMNKMKKDDFKLTFDTKTEPWFVIKVHDELTTNHKGIEDPEVVLMPEHRDNKMCPVHSFKMYLDHLNPENPYLRKKALKKPNKFNPSVWYSNIYIGKNTFARLIPEISCSLSKMYTNHSIHVTSVTILTRIKFTASQIMSITGQKSVQYLAHYQQTQDKKKLRWEM